MLQAGVYVNLYVFSLITGMMVLAGFVVAFAGYAVGGLLAWACRQERRKINVVNGTMLQYHQIVFLMVSNKFLRLCLNLLTLVFRLKRPQITAVSIETAFQGCVRFNLNVGSLTPLNEYWKSSVTFIIRHFYGNSFGLSDEHIGF